MISYSCYINNKRKCSCYIFILSRDKCLLKHHLSLVQIVDLSLYLPENFSENNE